MNTDINEFINVLESFTIANEDYSDLYMFITRPNVYLDDLYDKNSILDEDYLYTTQLATGGDIYISAIKACNELIKVGYYDEAYLICEKMIKLMNKLLKSTSKVDIDILKDSIKEMRSFMVNIIKQKEEYESKRKSIYAKYESILK